VPWLTPDLRTMSAVMVAWTRRAKSTAASVQDLLAAGLTLGVVIFGMAHDKN